jgi:regulator of extracellular matrix RemA (YlzA/DUF370 family)
MKTNIDFDKNLIKFINIGFGNVVNKDRIVSIMAPDTVPAKRLINDTRALNKLIDATSGRKTRSILIMDTGHIIICGLNADTITARLNLQDDKVEDIIDK